MCTDGLIWKLRPSSLMYNSIYVKEPRFEVCDSWLEIFQYGRENSAKSQPILNSYLFSNFFGPVPTFFECVAGIKFGIIADLQKETIKVYY